jgi:predicted amidohydrolase
MDQLTVSLIQTDIVWENRQENLGNIRHKLQMLAGKTDLAILPEMFSTGFSMQSRLLAEPPSGATITQLSEQAKEYNMAITGSYMAEENNSYYNRAFFLAPNGDSYFYDKRHLFRMGSEAESFSAGSQRIIIPYKGWNICLLVCNDLRFPVWSRNRNNEYDLLIYVANWPAARRKVWDILLQARAMENMSYLCGVNRIGTDGNNLRYDGGSIAYSPKGEVIEAAEDNREQIVTVTLDSDQQTRFREKFPAWKDADSFTIHPA